MKLYTLVVGPLGVNCTILENGSGECIIFDPGDEFQKIDQFLKSKTLKPIKILNTHGHFDHVGAVQQLRKAYEIPFYIHKGDENLTKMASQTATMYGLPPVLSPDIDGYLVEGDVFEFGNVEIEVIETDGHSAGGVCFLLKEMETVIAGDTLFRGSIGRTDFPYADHKRLISNIKNKLFTLEEQITVITGHGESTTIGYEKQNNPFID